MSADENTKTNHSNISDATQNMHKAINAAQRLIVDDDLEAWVANQNVSKGIYLVPALTRQEARVVKERMGVEMPRTQRAAAQWLQRSRRRRGLRLRKFSVLARLDWGACMARPARRRTQNMDPRCPLPNKFWL